MKGGGGVNWRRMLCIHKQSNTSLILICSFCCQWNSNKINSETIYVPDMHKSHIWHFEMRRLAWLWMSESVREHAWCKAIQNQAWKEESVFTDKSRCSHHKLLFLCWLRVGIIEKLKFDWFQILGANYCSEISLLSSAKLCCWHNNLALFFFVFKGWLHIKKRNFNVKT